MTKFKHTLRWHCPQCGRTERTVNLSASREVEVDQKVCAGTLISHGPCEMYWTDHSVREIHYAQGGYIAPLQSLHTTPGKAVDFNMSSPFGALGSYVDRAFLQDIARLHTPTAAIKAKEKADVIAKIQEGDVIQLVSKAGAVLQGEVLAVRRQRGRVGPPAKVRIKGFDHVGGNAGGHHVYWPLVEFDVEILVESYRLTDEDRAIAVIAGYQEDAFKTLSESRRQSLRHQYAARLNRAKALLKGEGG